MGKKGSACYGNYDYDAGDVPGWGSIKSFPSIINIALCGGKCDTTPGCCSFEYSPTEKICNLNTECKPTTTEVYKDYRFCVKTSKCPRPYSNHNGDVPGWGSIKSFPSISDIVGCGGKCDTTPGCCSIEYSPTEKICNLNTECKPTTTVVYKDYLFCAKEEAAQGKPAGKSPGGLPFALKFAMNQMKHGKK